MIPAETSPSRLFSKMFLQGKPEEIKAQKQRLDDGKSILDELGTQASQLKKKTSQADNHLLADYFESVRAAEKNIAAQQGWLDRPKPKVNAEPPKDIADAADMIGRVKLLMNLVPLIVQTDSSRIISVMIQDHYVVPKVEGVTGNHHNLSHHGQDRSKLKQLERIETEIVKCYSSLLSQLKSKTESDRTLLDRSTVLFGSNLGNANAHQATNLPIFLAGGGFDHGSYVDCDDSQPKPLCNLFLTMLQSFGANVDSFGQSNGTLTW